MRSGRSLPSWAVGADSSVATPKSVLALSSAEAAASLNDLSPRPVTSNSRPTFLPAPSAVSVGKGRDLAGARLARAGAAAAVVAAPPAVVAAPPAVVAAPPPVVAASPPAVVSLLLPLSLPQATVKRPRLTASAAAPMRLRRKRMPSPFSYGMVDPSGYGHIARPGKDDAGARGRLIGGRSHALRDRQLGRGAPYHRRRCGLPHPPVRPVLPGRVRGGLAPPAASRRSGRSSWSSPATSSTAGGASTPSTAGTACSSSSSRWATRSSPRPSGGPGAAAAGCSSLVAVGADLGGPDLVQVRRVDLRDGQRRPRRHAPPGQRDPAHRRVVLRLPGHQLRGRHLPPAPAAGAPARLRHLPVVLPPPRRRSDRAGRRVRAPDGAPGRPPRDRRRPGLPADHVRPGQEGDRGRAARGLDRQAGLRQPDPVRRHRQPLRRLRLRHPDLRRLLRLHRHRHRPRAAARHPLPAELQLAVHRHHAAGLLAALAHDPVPLAARLPLHRPRRQPEGRDEDLHQPLPHHVPGRAVARRELDVRRVGDHPRGRAGPGADLDAAAGAGRARRARTGRSGGRLAHHVQRGLPGLDLLPRPDVLGRLRRHPPDRHRLGHAGASS